MPTSKRAHSTARRITGSFGLLANGSSGKWELAIDESTSGADRWFLQIEGPVVAFYFEIPSVEIIAKMRQLLEHLPGATKPSPSGASRRTDSLVISKDKTTPVTLVKDDEYPDRFFLVVGFMDRPIVRFVLAGMDAADIAAALRQVQEDVHCDT